MKLQFIGTYNFIMIYYVIQPFIKNVFMTTKISLSVDKRIVSECYQPWVTDNECDNLDQPWVTDNECDKLDKVRYLLRSDYN
jgi:hypothetical protein